MAQIENKKANDTFNPNRIVKYIKYKWSKSFS